MSNRGSDAEFVKKPMVYAIGNFFCRKVVREGEEVLLHILNMIFSPK